MMHAFSLCVINKQAMTLWVHRTWSDSATVNQNICRLWDMYAGQCNCFSPIHDEVTISFCETVKLTTNTVNFWSNVTDTNRRNTHFSSNSCEPRTQLL